MEQLVILLIIGAVSLIKWLMERSAEARTRNETIARSDAPAPRATPVAPPMRAPRPVASSDFPDMDEAARRLRKALGLPDEAELPPIPRPVVRPAEAAESSPPPVIVFERPLRRPEVAPDLERRVLVPPPIVRAAPKQAAPSPAAELAPARPALTELLRSRRGLQQAILAQEILGTPKGLVF